VNPSRALILVLATLASALFGPTPVASASAAPTRALPQTEAIGSLQLVSEQDAALEQAYGHVAIASGSVVEPSDQKGVATLLARLLVTDDLRSFLEERGGSIESSVDLDAIRFDFTCAPADLEGTLSRLNAALLSSEYETGKVAAARTALIAELEPALRTVESMADQAAEQILYGRFTEYAATPNLEHLRKLTAPDLQAYHRAHIGANRLVCSVVSSLNSEKTKAAVSAGFEGLANVGPKPADPKRPLYVPALTKIFVIDVPDADHSVIRLASPGLFRSSAPETSLESWRWAANGGPESRMQQEVVQADLATSVECGFESDWNRMGYFSGAISASHENIGEALQAYMTVLQDHRNGRIKRVELEEGRERFEEMETARAANPTVRAYRMAQTTLHGYPADHYATYASVTKAVRGNYINAALARNILVRSMIIVAAGPADKITENLQYYTDTLEYTLERPASNPEAVAQVERMFESLGGKQLWADLQGAEIRVETEVEQSGSWRTRTGHLWRYFDSVYTRMEMSSISEQTSAINGNPGWVQGNLGIRNASNSRYRVEVLNTRRWLYSLLHQLALEDSIIVSDLDEEGRLVFSDRMGEICKLILAENGRPERMLFTDNSGDQQVIYKTWSKSGDYLYSNEMSIPYKDLRTDTEYPQYVRSFVPNPPFDPALFEKPSEE